MPPILSALLAAFFLATIYHWATSCLSWVAARRRAFAASLGLVLVVQTATGWLIRHRHGAMLEDLHATLDVVIMTMGIATLPLLLIRAISAVTAWFARARRTERTPADAPPVPDQGLMRRQVLEGGGGMAFLAGSGLVLGWGALRGRHEFELCEVPVRIPGLPRALDGYVIAQISDIHAGIHVGDREIDEGLALVRRARPDLVVVTGDLVDIDLRHAKSLVRKLADLPARDGVAAILGNHDYYDSADGLLAALRDAGVETLVNRGRLVRAGDGGGFALLGVDDLSSTDHGRSGPQLGPALATVPPDVPRVLLSHQPHTVDRWAGSVALQLSGHTHGGQINPGFRPADMFFRYVAGAYAVRGTTLYVNRGFGTVGPPSRVGAPPEVTRVVLVAA
jgi:predicted MPP superfamily phosphohydrolase